MEYSAGYADIGIAGTMPRSGLCRVRRSNVASAHPNRARRSSAALDSRHSLCRSQAV